MDTSTRITIAGSHRGVRSLLAAGLAALGLLVACGGGDEASVAAGGTGSTSAGWAHGPISGLGSIIVNGVRYDDSQAHIEDDDGSAHGSSRLKVGMMVEVQSSRVDDSTQRARADHIRFGSEIVGPIGTADASSFTVLGQVVDIVANTVFDDSLAGGAAALTPGLVVEVHALYDAATGRYTATRIEDKQDATAFKLRGQVASLDTTARTFALGNAVVAYGAASSVPSNLANGQRVRVTLQPTQVDGRWQAITVRTGVRSADDHADGRVHGTVTAFTSAQDFEVNGTKVDATNARFEPGPQFVALGVHVRVKGAVVSGVLVATEVKVDSRGEASRGGVELHGAVSSLDGAAKTFVVRGVTVDYSGSIDWHDGSEANLVDGAQVEVKGTWSADHRTLKATKIEFES